MPSSALYRPNRRPCKAFMAEQILKMNKYHCDVKQYWFAISIGPDPDDCGECERGITSFHGMTSLSLYPRDIGAPFAHSCGDATLFLLWIETLKARFWAQSDTPYYTRKAHFRLALLFSFTLKYYFIWNGMFLSKTKWRVTLICEKLKYSAWNRMAFYGTVQSKSSYHIR